MNETVETTETGAILYDRAIVNQISDASFSVDGWPSAVPVEGSLRSAGRGKTMFVSDGHRDFVLRHYLRGGLVRLVTQDRYLWRGPEHSRSFAEWRLLSGLVAMGLPVPQPAAARYQRRGLCYTADLLTIKARDITPLSERLARGPAEEDFWRGIGRGLRRFHDAGVCHADLNAYNVQVDDRDRIFLLDFDRGKILPAGPWQNANLVRLLRSLRKLKRLDPALRFDDPDWRSLLDGYEP